MQFDMFKPVACANTALAASFTGGDRTKPENRRPHILHAPRAKSFDGVISGKVTRYCAGKAQGCDELTRKRAGAVGMMEGWREVLNEPDHQRVGLLQMAVQCHV